jgi:hypothetical protein
VPFSYTVPVNNIFGYPDPLFLNNPDNFQELSLPATISPVISDGYWLMLAPFSPGEYTINFGGEGDVAGLQNTTYIITVAPVGEPTSPLSLLALGTLGVTLTLNRKLKK